MRRVVLTYSALLLLATGTSGLCSDLDDFKAAHERSVAALNALDVDGLLAVFHEQLVAFDAENPFPWDMTKAPSKAELRKVFRDAMANVERMTMTMIDPQYRLIGNTGINWGHYRIEMKLKGGPVKTTYIRAMAIYTKLDGKWVQVAYHNSFLPTGR